MCGGPASTGKQMGEGRFIRDNPWEGTWETEAQTSVSELRDQRRHRSDEDTVETNPLSPGESMMGYRLREARVKILDTGGHGCFPLLW